jgi:hypothetical protein
MAQTPEDSGDDSKLELPSLSIFRRGKKQQAADEPAGETFAETPGEPSAVPSSEPDQPTEPLAELGSEADEPDVEEPAPAGTPELETMFPNAVAEADAEPDGQPDGDPTEVLPTDHATVPEVEPDQGDEYDDAHTATETAGEPGRPEEPAAKPKRERKPLVLPALDGRIAAPLTGIVVGLAGVALTFIGTKGCEAVKGTGSCGGVGLFLLIAILALMVLLGAALLKAWSIADPTNSSFLAVGLMAVLAMLFFLPSIDRWYMVIVIPVVTALTFLLSWWVTHRFIESADQG